MIVTFWPSSRRLAISPPQDSATSSGCGATNTWATAARIRDGSLARQSTLFALEGFEVFVPQSFELGEERDRVRRAGRRRRELAFDGPPLLEDRRQARDGVCLLDRRRDLPVVERGAGP